MNHNNRSLPIRNASNGHLSGMTDEQLATADELIRDEIRTGDHGPGAQVVLVRQLALINAEAKRRASVLAVRCRQ